MLRILKEKAMQMIRILETENAKLQKENIKLKKLVDLSTQELIDLEVVLVSSNAETIRYEYLKWLETKLLININEINHNNTNTQTIKGTKC